MTAVSYLNWRIDACFEVVFGSFAGRAWAHLAVPHPRSSSKSHAETAYSTCGLPGLNEAMQLLNLGRQIPGGEGCILGDIRTVLTPNKDESLVVDEILTTFSRALIELGFELGDLGNWSNETFVREGNISDHRTSVALDPVQHEIRYRRDFHNKGGYVKFGTPQALCSRQSRCLSLPDDKHKELLKALSTDLQGRYISSQHLYGVQNCTSIRLSHG